MITEANSSSSSSAFASDNLSRFHELLLDDDGRPPFHLDAPFILVPVTRSAVDGVFVRRFCSALC